MGFSALLWVGLVGSAWADGPPAAVVTLDNGGFNALMYTERFNGAVGRPSVAESLLTEVGRAFGAQPRVYTYLPIGRVPGQPGGLYPYYAHRPSCAVPEQAPSWSDPCACPVGERCFDGLGTNSHPSASTSLYLTASRVREMEVPLGPRVELHVTDLFEEEPGATTGSFRADKCVTAEGTARAVRAVMALDPQFGEVRYAAVGLLNFSVRPLPGRSASGVRFVEKEAGCWSGERAPARTAAEAPWSMGMAVIALGVGLDDGADFMGRLSELGEQMSVEGVTLDFVPVRLPDVERALEGTVDAADLAAWRVEGLPVMPGCDRVDAAVALSGADLPLIASASASCAGDVTLSVDAQDARRAFHRRAGLNPTVRTLPLAGEIVVESGSSSVSAGLEALGKASLADDRPVVLWSVLPAALSLDAAEPWRLHVLLDGVTVHGLDTRPWGIAALVGMALGLAAALSLLFGLERLQAGMAFQRRLGAVGGDPLRQRPLLMVLEEARIEVRRRWFLRWTFSMFVGLLIGVSAFLLVLYAHRVALG